MNDSTGSGDIINQVREMGAVIQEAAYLTVEKAAASYDLVECLNWNFALRCMNPGVYAPVWEHYGTVESLIDSCELTSHEPRLIEMWREEAQTIQGLYRSLSTMETIPHTVSVVIRKNGIHFEMLAAFPEEAKLNTLMRFNEPTQYVYFAPRTGCMMETCVDLFKNEPQDADEILIHIPYRQWFDVLVDIHKRDRANAAKFPEFPDDYQTHYRRGITSTGTDVKQEATDYLLFGLQGGWTNESSIITIPGRLLTDIQL